MVTILSEMQADSGLYLSLSALLLLYPSGLTADCCWYSSSIFSAWSGCGALWSYLYISDQNPWVENRIDFLPKSLNWEQDRCSTILRDLRIGAVEWEYVVTCESNTARWDAWSLWHWPVTRVFKGANNSPLKTVRLLSLFVKYCVNAVAMNPDYWISPWSAIDFRESGCILKLIVWVLMVGVTDMIQWQMSPFDSFWLHDGSSKNLMVGWDV